MNCSLLYEAYGIGGYNRDFPVYFRWLPIFIFFEFE